MAATKEKTQKITAEELENMFGDSIYDAISHVNDFKMPYPSIISKPSLAKNHTSAEAKEYAKLLSAYESSKENYNQACSEVRNHNGELELVIEEYIKEISDLKIHVPADKQSKVYSYAYSESHSEGMAHVFHKLRDLVELFK